MVRPVKFSTFFHIRFTSCFRHILVSADRGLVAAFSQTIAVGTASTVPLGE